MAKHKRRRFRLKNIKRLFCCCCPFGKKRYSLEGCDDGEDDLRGRFTLTWGVTDIDLSNRARESPYGEDTLTVFHSKRDGRDEGQVVQLHTTSAWKRNALLHRTEVKSENASFRVIEAQRWKYYSFQIIQFQIPEYASIQTTLIQQWREAAFQIPHDHARGPLPHTAICTFAKRTLLLHRRQGDVYSHGRSVLVSFLHLLYEGTYYYERRVQTFRNHCIINYQSMFVATYPDIFSFIFGRDTYVITYRSVSFQILESIEYNNRIDAIGDNIIDAQNVAGDDKSDDDGDETGDHDIIQNDTDASICENISDNSGPFSGIAGNIVITKNKLIIVYNNPDLQNRLTRSDALRKSDRNKNSGIPRYCDSEIRMQDSNNQVPARSKQNGRVPVKATLSAASDPPPGHLKQPAPILPRYCIAEKSMLKSPPVLSMWHKDHPYLRITPSHHFHNNNYLSIRSLCNHNCIGAILSVGFIILAYIAYYLM